MINLFSAEQSTTFNPILIQDIHYSWIRAMPNGELIEKLREVSGEKVALTNFIQQYFPINEVCEEKSKNMVTSIEKSTSKDLYNIVLKAGATQFSKKIRQFIKKQDVLQLNKALGDMLYYYSLSDSPAVYPNLDEYELKAFSINNDPMANIINAGYRSLRITLSDLPENYIYKLPKPWDTTFNNISSSESISKGELALHKDLILKLLASRDAVSA